MAVRSKIQTNKGLGIAASAFMFRNDSCNSPREGQWEGNVARQHVTLRDRIDA